MANFIIKQCNYNPRARARAHQIWGSGKQHFKTLGLGQQIINWAWAQESQPEPKARAQTPRIAAREPTSVQKSVFQKKNELF